jgi:hypothetical protein
VSQEDPEEIFFFVETEDGRIMAVDSKGNLRTPTPSPAPSSLTPDDSRDDSSDDNNNEDEDAEEQPTDDGNNNNNDGGNQADAPHAARARLSP